MKDDDMRHEYPTKYDIRNEGRRQDLARNDDRFEDDEVSLLSMPDQRSFQRQQPHFPPVIAPDNRYSSEGQPAYMEPRQRSRSSSF